MVLLADGSVRFVSDAIDAGDDLLVAGGFGTAGHFGVWGDRCH
ncbi:MAG: hypothetical protein R3C49_07405 [Planctomycetaceae bacterium]